MPHKDLIPGADPDYDKFMTAFYQAISAGLLKWKIPQTEVDPSTPLLISWKNSYGACQIKKSASSVDIDLKNADKAVLSAFTRPFIQKWVYLNSNMTDNDIQKCGLKPHSKDRKHAGKPDSIPAIGKQVDYQDVLEAIFFLLSNDQIIGQNIEVAAGVRLC